MREFITGPALARAPEDRDMLPMCVVALWQCCSRSPSAADVGSRRVGMIVLYVRLWGRHAAVTGKVPRLRCLHRYHSAVRARVGVVRPHFVGRVFAFEVCCFGAPRAQTGGLLTCPA